MLHVYAGTKFLIYKVWWVKEASQIRQTFIPLCEKDIKTQHKIPIDPAILAAIGHFLFSFFFTIKNAKAFHIKEIKIKNTDMRV